VHQKVARVGQFGGDDEAAAGLGSWTGISAFGPQRSKWQRSPGRTPKL
jgi:hypothetical protein